MLALRDLECLIALARYRHFAKAAQHCGMSQPAFSMRIRNLEEQLDSQIVKRGNRFQGLTPEGEMILDRARSIVGDVRALEEEVRAAHGAIQGVLNVGAIPTASGYAGNLAGQLKQSHPGISMRIHTTTSFAVQQGVLNGLFDVGITYFEGVAPDLVDAQDLYTERYVLLAPASLDPPQGTEMTWAEAAQMPLVLLEREMQNRKILEAVFDDVGVEPTIAGETSGFLSAVTMVGAGVGATVLPEVLLETLGSLNGTQSYSLIDPTVEKSICLVTKRKEIGLPATHALKELLEDQTQ